MCVPKTGESIDHCNMLEMDTHRGPDRHTKATLHTLDLRGVTILYPLSAAAGGGQRPGQAR